MHCRVMSTGYWSRGWWRGGLAGTVAGRLAGKALAGRKNLLERGFAAVVIAVGGFVAWSAR